LAPIFREGGRKKKRGKGGARRKERRKKRKRKGSAGVPSTLQWPSFERRPKRATLMADQKKTKERKGFLKEKKGEKE